MDEPRFSKKEQFWLGLFCIFLVASYFAICLLKIFKEAGL